MLKKYLCIVMMLFTSIGLSKNVIKDYQRMFLPIYSTDGNLMIAIRVFKMNDIPSFLVVNPNNLTTTVLPISQLRSKNTKQTKKPGYFTHWDVVSTRYYQLLNKSTAAPYVLENQGITHAEHASKGNILTIDLCPSSKSFEAGFFNKLVELSAKSHKPTPITIAISGMWLIEHLEEFQWLLSKEKDKTLDITWANHSFSHVYYKDLPYSENFMLSPAINLNTEILQTEQYLLEEGELPSVFFRFPGLVSNESLVKQLKRYGLIPLGADAWVAELQLKHQTIAPNGIILVHGNGNEHEGITLISPLLNQLIFVDIKTGI